MTSAEICRANGRTPGTVLLHGDDSFGVYAISAVGLCDVMVLKVGASFKQNNWKWEHRRSSSDMHLSILDYREPTPSELAAMGPEIAAEIKRIRKVLGVQGE